MSKACVFLADGFEEVEALTVVDLLRRAGVETWMVSVMESLSVTGSHGIEIKANRLFDETDYEEIDLLVLPGGMPGTTNLAGHEGLEKLLRDFCGKNKKLAAICAAPSVLGGLGLLNEKKAVCYPGFEQQLTGAAVVKEEVAVDQNITTSRGVGTAIPFALELIRQLAGDECARKIQDAILYK